MKKWLKVPVILSAVLGGVPAFYTLINTVYWMGSFFGAGTYYRRMIGAGFALFLILAAIWLVTGIVMGVRRLRGRRIAAT